MICSSGAHSRLAIALLAAAVPAAMAQTPVINPHGVVNGGSFMSPGLPGGSIARGSAFTIFGQALGPTPAVGVTSLPFATTLGGVSIKVTQGTVALDAIPFVAGAGQVNAIMPSNTPLGLVSVRLTYNGVQSNPSPVNVVDSSLGLIGAQGPGIIQNFNNQNDQPVNSPFKPAKPGQIEILWATGLGPVSFADNDTPKTGNLSTPLELWVGGQSVTDIKYQGRSSYPGIDEIIFTVPTGAPLGCWVPVQARTDGNMTSNAVTMAISADGSPCQEPSNPLGQKLLTGGNIAVVGLTRLAGQSGFVRKLSETLDLATLSVRQETPGSFPFNPLFSLPPAGSCTLYTAPGDLFGDDSLVGAAPSGRYLDIGSTYSVFGGKSLQNVPRFVAPLPTLIVGQKSPFGVKDSLIFNPGQVGMSAQGGNDLGGFTVGSAMPQPLVWTNEDQIQVIDRSQPLVINWSSAPTGFTVVILGINADQSSNSSAAFVCVAQANTTSFTVPTYILYGVRATRGYPLKSRATLFVGALPLAKPVTFLAKGLDLGVAYAITASSKHVIFK